MTALRSDADELPGVAPYAPSRALVLLALAAFIAMERPTWHDARAVYLGLVESYLGVSVRYETETEIIAGIQSAERPLVALAVFCNSTIEVWGREAPDVAAPLRQLAAKLDPERAGRRSMLDADEPPGCLAGGVTTRADVAPRDPGPCPVCSGPRRLAADSLASAGSVKALRILYCPTCAGEGRVSC